MPAEKGAETQVVVVRPFPYTEVQVSERDLEYERMVNRIEADGPSWQSLSGRVLIWAVFGVVWLFVFASTPSDAQQNAPPASTPQALAAYTQAANFQNNSAYDLAIEAWQKFLAAYPGDKKAEILMTPPFLQAQTLTLFNIRPI